MKNAIKCTARKRKIWLYALCSLTSASSECCPISNKHSTWGSEKLPKYQEKRNPPSCVLKRNTTIPITALVIAIPNEER